MEREDFKGPYPYYGAVKDLQTTSAKYRSTAHLCCLQSDGSVRDIGRRIRFFNHRRGFWADSHTHILRGT